MHRIGFSLSRLTVAKQKQMHAYGCHQDFGFLEDLNQVLKNEALHTTNPDQYLPSIETLKCYVTT